jgi:hypothetical protein
MRCVHGRVLRGWSDNAREAMQRAPDYFVWWYTVKSIGLGLAAGLVGYLIGRSRCRG